MSTNIDSETRLDSGVVPFVLAFPSNSLNVCVEDDDLVGKKSDVARFLERHPVLRAVRETTWETPESTIVSTQEETVYQDGNERKTMIDDKQDTVNRTREDFRMD